MSGIAANQDTNYGAASAIAHGTLYEGAKTNLDRPIANFDVSLVAARTINAAELHRSFAGGFGVSFGAKIFRCTRPTTWTELGVTWNKYDGTNSWTAGGGDYDSSTPTPIAFTEGAAETITGLKPFVDDAIANRGNILSIIIRADNEDPGIDAWISWHSKDTPSPIGIWFLLIDYAGAPLNVLAERSFQRGVLRGARRGAL
jgi:hypothetical protein